MANKGHPANPGYEGGNNWDTCDRCGVESRVDDLALEWTGLTVHIDGCFEMRHPQDFLRISEEQIVADLVGTRDADSTTNQALYVGPYTYQWWALEETKVPTDNLGMQDLAVEPDGTTIIALGTTTDNELIVYENAVDFTLDQVAASSVTDIDIASPGANSLITNVAGTKVWVRDGTKIDQYSWGGWSGAPVSESTEDFVAFADTSRGLMRNADATVMWITNTTGRMIYTLNLSDPLDITTAVRDAALDFDYSTLEGFETAIIANMQWSTDGLLLYVLSTGGAFYRYVMGVAYVLTSVTSAALVEDDTTRDNTVSVQTSLVGFFMMEDLGHLYGTVALSMYHFTGDFRNANTIPTPTHTGTL